MRDAEFVLRGEYIALNDLLKACGAAASGGAAKLLVAAGAVAVDSEVETRKTRKIRAGQVVTAPGWRIRVRAPAG